VSKRPFVYTHMYVWNACHRWNRMKRANGCCTTRTLLGGARHKVALHNRRSHISNHIAARPSSHLLTCQRKSVGKPHVLCCPLEAMKTPADNQYTMFSVPGAGWRIVFTIPCCSNCENTVIKVHCTNYYAH